jgi:hypothetical protein
MVPANYSEGRVQDFAFFNILGGEKNHDKTSILNKCLHLEWNEVALSFWKREGKSTGSSQFHQVLEHPLFNEV